MAPHGQTLARRDGGTALRVVLGTLLGLAGVGFFLFLGFPYDTLRSRVAGALSAASGARVAVAELGPGFGLAGPRLVARGVTARWPEGARLEAERLHLRPAWSLSWLRGEPALALGLEGAWGRVNGTITLGEEPGFRGRVRDLDLDRLPVASWRPGADLDGTLDARLDLARDGPGALAGSASFEALEGLVGLPELPLAVPYTTLAGELRFGEGALAEILELELLGPVVNLSLQGELGAAAILERAPLRMTGRLEVTDPAMRDAFRAQGVALDPDGTRAFRLTGTLAAPQVR